MSKARVLVVEDEGVVQLDIRQRLLGLGYQVVGAAATGAEAVRLAGSLLPDLILMDIKLKGEMDGITAADEIHRLHKLPVVFLTAFADERTLQRAQMAEAFGYILKPFDDRDLSISIEMALYKHQAEQKLRDSEERYMLATQGANDGLWDWKLAEQSIYFSTRWKAMLGYAEDEIKGVPDEWFQRIHPDDLNQFKLNFSAHIDGLTQHFECEHRIRHKDHEYRWVLTRGMAVRDEKGAAYRISGSQTDITDRKRAEEQLLTDALYDSLTGLPNRVLFHDRLAQAIEHCNRKETYAFGVLFLDLDQFKVINDSLGHNTGDQLLIEIARMLQSCVRSVDTVARLGGDEFVILLDDIHSIDETTQVTQRIQDMLLSPLQVGVHSVHIATSIGVVYSQRGYERTDDILRDADIAMYQAKALGKSRSVLFEPHMRAQAIERMETENDLRQAIAQGHFLLYYQPIISLKTRQIAGLEALLRWQHPSRGLLLPGEFLSIAEETGLIVPIGAWVLRAACQQLKQWQAGLPGQNSLYISINVSSRQLENNDFTRQVLAILQETGVEAGNLRFEITESMLIGKNKKIDNTLRLLDEIGIQFYVGDFGMGFSTLGYVQRCPVNTIKIDRNFTSQMEERGDNKITRSILRFAQDMGLDTIAEGIENASQYENLSHLRCTYGQGFYISRPIDAGAVDALLVKKIGV